MRFTQADTFELSLRRHRPLTVAAPSQVFATVNFRVWFWHQILAKNYQKNLAGRRGNQRNTY